MTCKNWGKCKLVDLIDSVSVRHNFNKDKLIFLNTSDILEGKFLHSDYSDVKSMPGQAKKSIQKNDILFSEIRPKNKRFAYVYFNADDYVVSTKLMVLRKKSDRVDNVFLYHLLTNSKMLDYLQMIAEGRSGTFPQITFNELKNIVIDLPPINEQKAIANILSSLDEKIEINKVINNKLEEKTQAIFKQWFIDFEFPNEEGKPYKTSGGAMVESELGMIPEGWRVGSLRDLAEIIMGQSPKGDTYNFTGKGLGLINGASDFKDGKINPLKYTTDPKKVSKIGDWIFGVRATVGNVTYVDNEYCLGRGVGVARVLNKVYREYMYFQLIETINYLEKTVTGSVYINISRADLERVKIIIPDDSILERYHTLINPSFDKKICLQRENEKLVHLRDTLLPKLMSGEIRVPVEE